MSASFYSGHKHHSCLKVLVIVDDRGRGRYVSDAYPGPVHDKTIWNSEYDRVASGLVCPTLGDRAYAGGTGKGLFLFRPLKRNETAWRRDAETCRTFNRLLSARRVRIEHMFSCLKAFRLIRDQFPLRRDRYAMIFRAVTLIYNVIMETKDREKAV
jgi:hypothetical protein